MIARLSDSKKGKAYKLVAEALTAGQLTKADTDKLSGYFSFCSSVVALEEPSSDKYWSSMQRSHSHKPTGHLPLQ
jgi:hypothetical protein